MEMRILSELGRWVLFDAELKQEWGQETWRNVFEACGSPGEWGEFVQNHRSDPILPPLRSKYEQIATQVLSFRVDRPRSQVILPDF